MSKQPVMQIKRMHNHGDRNYASLGSSLNAPPQQQFMDNSITLNGWSHSPQPPQASIPLTSSSNTVRDVNKAKLKRLLLLSLRHIGITKSRKDFNTIWRHLYTACVFALRQDLSGREVEQEQMLAVIKNNMTFLNVK